MDKVEIEKYRRQLEEIESKMTDEVIQEMTPEEISDYLILVSKIKLRLSVLEKIDG